MSDERPKVLGTVGDVNPIEHGGGFVLQYANGDVQIEYTDPPCEDWYESKNLSDSDAPFRKEPHTLYRVPCEEARYENFDFEGMSSEEYARENDLNPLHLTAEELTKRWDGFGGISFHTTAWGDPTADLNLWSDQAQTLLRLLHHVRAYAPLPSRKYGDICTFAREFAEQLDTLQTELEVKMACAEFYVPQHADDVDPDEASDE